MKISKKIGLVGAALVLVFTLLTSLYRGGAQAATGLSAAQLDNAYYKIISSSEIDGTIAGTTVKFIDSNPGDSTYNFKPQGSSFFCDGTIYGQNNSNKGITLDASFSDLEKTDNQSMSAVANLDYLNSSGTCQNWSSTINFAKDSSGAFVSTNTPGFSDPGGTGGGGGGTADQTCESGSGGFSLSWLLCPVLNGANALAAAFTKAFESELNFRISDLTKSSPQGEQNLQTSWSLIRDLASAALVIVMLIMVISQAVGGGPFDAYTVRKMLPRLVAAIILMQISWVLLSWVVNIFADLGEGIRQIMYAPFDSSGIKLDDFGALLANANISGAAAGAFNWAILIPAIGIAAAVALPTVLMFCFAGLVSFGVGLAVLVFRKIIIVMALVFAPIAILAWLLPGTESYFKKWRDMFIKALMMFPIAIGMIAAGRIFAYVAGNTGTGTFMNFFIVLVGFFGPLFLLPKTFKWGGEAMQSIGDGAFKLAEKGLIGKDAKPMKYFQNRQKDWDEQRQRLSYERVSNKTPFSPSRFWQYPLDRFRSGEYDLLKQTPGYKEVGKRSVQGYVKKGEDIIHEDEAAAEAKLVRERQRHRANGGQHDLYLQAIASGLEEYYDPNLKQMVKVGKRDHLEQVAARTQLAKLGAGMNWRYLENYFESTRQELEAAELEAQTLGVKNTPRLETARAESRDMRKFFDDNVDTILPKLPHIYKSIGQAADADPNGIAQMHGVEIEAVLSSLRQSIIDPTKGGGARVRDAATGQLRPMTEAEVTSERNSAQASLTRFIHNFQRAVENSQRGGPQLENGALRAMKAFLDPQEGVSNKILSDINDEPMHGRAAPFRTRSNPKNPGYKPPMSGEEPRTLQILERAPESIRNEFADLAVSIDEAGYVRSEKQTAAAVPVNGGGQQEQPPPTGGQAVRPTGPAPSGGGNVPISGFRSGGVGTAPAAVVYTGPAVPQQPVEGTLNIEHLASAIGESVRDATMQGTHEGVKQALSDTGLHKPGDTIQPDAGQGQPNAPGGNTGQDGENT